MKTSKAKHTKAPWIYKSGNGDFFPSVFIGEFQPQLVVNAGGGPLEEHEANAQLIASAPDMLAALESIESLLEEEVLSDGDILHIVQTARSAIAKAKGETT